MVSKDGIEIAFWALDAKAALMTLDTNEAGLTDEEARRRYGMFGPNVIQEQGKLIWLSILARQFTSPLLIILVIAGTITWVLGEVGDTVVIFGTVGLNALLGFYQENKAENTLALLKTYVKDRTRVRRGGREKVLEVSELVPGDIIRISQGDRVPADGRIIVSNDLQIDESILTGESLPVEKTSEQIAADVRVSDRRCVAYGGTSVVQGFADMVVMATGDMTEIGKIALLVKTTVVVKTPLQKAILDFTLKASGFLAVLTILVFIVGILSGRTVYEMFLISVATAISAVPEGLPIALTVILAVGVGRLAKRRGVVRKLLAAETLGSTSIILTDKTGTLTEAKMELEKILPIDGAGVSAEEMRTRMLSYALIHSDVVIENPEESPDHWTVTGRPIEVAMLKGAVRLGLSLPDLLNNSPVIRRLPFNSVNKFSGCLFSDGGKMKATFFGAPEVIMNFARMSDDERRKITEQVDALAHEGARVLAISMVEVGSLEEFSFDFLRKKKAVYFLGLLTFRDPVRPTVKDAIRRIGESGVRTVIVTGDHIGTAQTVASSLGFSLGEGSTLDGGEINDLDDSSLQRRLATASVIARTTPDQKLRIARLFMESGEVVAMTGDGVNDAPALREADIGIAVGAGSDVAKASADLIILDNNFETIVAALEEGRKIVHNVRKVVVYLLSDSLDSLLLIGGSILFGLALPINALQILWVNFFSDSFPAMALAFESNGHDIGNKPVGFKGGLMDKEVKFLTLVVGVLTSLSLFVTYVVLLKVGFQPAQVRTFIFASFGLYTLFLGFSVRSLKLSIFEIAPFSNRYMVASFLIGFALMAAALYVPSLQRLLHTVPLSPPWVVAVFVVGFANVAAIEFGKWLFRRNIL